MIGLSPLSAGHRRRFQPTCVRPSTGSYPRFSLPTDSSPGFASAARDSSRPVKARFRSGSLSVNLAPRQRLAGSFYKRHAVTPVKGAPTARGRTVSGTVSLPSRGAFHLSLTVLCAIGPYWYFALEGGPPCFPQGFTCLVVLWILSRACRISITGLSPSTAVLSNTILLSHLHLMTVLNPGSVSRSGLGSSPFARRY